MKKIKDPSHALLRHYLHQKDNAYPFTITAWIKLFLIKCVLFRGDERYHRVLGLIAWINIGALVYVMIHLSTILS